MAEKENLSNSLESEESASLKNSKNIYLQFWHKQRKILVRSILFIFASVFLITLYSSKSVLFNEKYSNLHNYSKQETHFYGYPPKLIDNLVRDKEISFVFPVYSGHAESLLNLLRSIRNLCNDCTHVPIIIITDDASQNLIHETLHKNHSLSDPSMKQSFPNLLIKCLRDVMPYYEANKWNDNSLLVNGKKYMEYRVVDVGTLLGGNFSPLFQAVTSSGSGGMIERIVAYYHFIMSNQILYRKYMEYRVVDVRTLLGGNFSPLFQAVTSSGSGGMIERIGLSMIKFPKIYNDIIHIWKIFQIPFYRPEGDERVQLDFVLDTDAVVMTNNFMLGLYRMGMSDYWKNPQEALKNAEKQGWKSLADHLKNRTSQTRN
ncbi:unnamed protein product [Adineta ricciae]|uniref:Uncharacterized protein n=1 Tax=Adineta ricciae TaxID=249248 RepID=A0A814VAD7_ADIRI|nr:unnamed protein product [Adineta ricciae]